MKEPKEMKDIDTHGLKFLILGHWELGWKDKSFIPTPEATNWLKDVKNRMIEEYKKEIERRELLK